MVLLNHRIFILTVKTNPRKKPQLKEKKMSSNEKEKDEKDFAQKKFDARIEKLCKEVETTQTTDGHLIIKKTGKVATIRGQDPNNLLVGISLLLEENYEVKFVSMNGCFYAFLEKYTRRR